MTRVVDGIYDEVELDTGFFISDKETDIVCEWLAAYSEALEKAWARKGSQGNPRTAKHAKVRSFITAVAKKRKAHDALCEELEKNKKSLLTGSEEK